MSMKLYENNTSVMMKKVANVLTLPATQHLTRKQQAGVMKQSSVSVLC